MNKLDLIEALSKETGITLRKAEEVVNTVFNGMANALTKGDRVEIRGFWSFKVKKYKGYKGRNPKTGEFIKVKPKKLPFFKCAKELKEMVDIHKKKGGEIMKQLKNDLKAVSKSLKQLTRKAEQIAKQLDKLEKAQAPKKTRAKVTKNKVAKKSAKATAIATVFAVIKKSKKGVGTATLIKNTGFDDKKIWNNINMLKKQGKIRSGGRGIYVKA